MAENLIIGANGLVGGALKNLLDSESISWLGTSFKRSSDDLVQLDICNSEQVKKVVLELKPKNIFHCANLAGGVNNCEQNPELARRFHFDGTKNLVDAAKEVGASFSFISTDYVFSDSSDPVIESHERTPLNVYGELKKASEDYISNHLEKYVIARTTNIYGYDPETVTPNYFMQVYRSLSAGEPIKCPQNLSGTPTYAEDLVKSIFELLQKETYGIFHIVGPEAITRFSWSKEIAKALSFDESLVSGFDVIDQPGGVKRPKQLQLSSEKLNAVIDFKLKNVEEGLKAIINKRNSL